jgi:hypothetical protein
MNGDKPSAEVVDAQVERDVETELRGSGNERRGRHGNFGGI